MSIIVKFVASKKKQREVERTKKKILDLFLFKGLTIKDISKEVDCTQERIFCFLREVGKKCPH